MPEKLKVGDTIRRDKKLVVQPESKIVAIIQIKEGDEVGAIDEADEIIRGENMGIIAGLNLLDDPTFEGFADPNVIYLVKKAIPNE